MELFKKRRCLIVNKKLKDLGYVTRRFIDACEELNALDRGYNYHCSEVFQGKYLAELNKMIWNEKCEKARKKVVILKKIRDHILEEGNNG